MGNYGLRVNKRIVALATTQKKIAVTTPITQQKSTSISRQSLTKKRLNASLNIAPGQTRSVLLKNRSALNAIKYQVIPKAASRYFKVSLKKVFGKACGTQSRCMRAKVIALRGAVAGDYSLSLIDANNRKVGAAQIKVSTFTAQKTPTPLSKSPDLSKKKTGTANWANRALPSSKGEPKTSLNNNENTRTAPSTTTLGETIAKRPRTRPARRAKAAPKESAGKTEQVGIIFVSRVSPRSPSIGQDSAEIIVVRGRNLGGVTSAAIIDNDRAEMAVKIIPA